MRKSTQNPLERYAAPDADLAVTSFSISIPMVLKKRLKELAEEATRLQRAAGLPGVVSINQLINDAISDFAARCDTPLSKPEQSKRRRQ